MKKQALFVISKNKVSHYGAQPPKKLLSIAQERIENLESAMGTLLAMDANANYRPNVQMYEGVEGIKMCYEDTLNYPKSTLKAFLGYGEIQSQLKRWLDNRYLPQRIKHQILARVLAPGKLQSEYYYPPHLDPKTYGKYTELGFIQDSVFDLYNEINLYGEDKVFMVMFRQEEMMGMIIKSKLLYNTLSALFDLTWKREING